MEMITYVNVQGQSNLDSGPTASPKWISSIALKERENSVFNELGKPLPL